MGYDPLLGHHTGRSSRRVEAGAPAWLVAAARSEFGAAVEGHGGNVYAPGVEGALTGIDSLNAAIAARNAAAEAMPAPVAEMPAAVMEGADVQVDFASTDVPAPVMPAEVL